MAFIDDFKVGIERSVRILKMDRAAITEVAGDAKALPVGVAIATVAGLSAMLPAFPVGLVLGPVLLIVMSFVLAGLWYVVGTLFKPQRWDFQELYRATSHTLLAEWIGVLYYIPVLGQLLALAVGIYRAVLAVVIVETISGLDRTKSILIVVIPLAICCGLAVAAFFMGAAALVTGAMGAAAQ